MREKEEGEGASLSKGAKETSNDGENSASYSDRFGINYYDLKVKMFIIAEFTYNCVNKNKSLRKSSSVRYCSLKTLIQFRECFNEDNDVYVFPYIED